MKRVLTVTFLNHFVSGGLALVIPLLLLERNVNLAEIGVVISILPLVFLVVRLVFAALADQVGWARFYLLLNWPGALVSNLIYLIANSVPTFLLGRIVEAVKMSSYWAVNRTAIFSLSPSQKAKWVTKNAAVLSLSTAIGSAVSGIALSLMGFSLTLSMLVLVSSIMVVPAALLWSAKIEVSRVGFMKTISLLNPRGKGRTFWLASLTMLFSSLTFYPLFSLLLPVFMAQQLKYDYVTIGVALMLYGFLTAAVTFGSLRIPLDIRRAGIQSAVALSVLLFLASSGSHFLSLFLLLAVADGLGIGFYECVIARVTRNKRTVSVDVGLLHVPRRIAEFISVLLAGFIVQSFGYLPAFAASGIFFVIFSFLSLFVLKA